MTERESKLKKNFFSLVMIYSLEFHLYDGAALANIMMLCVTRLVLLYLVRASLYLLTIFIQFPHHLYPLPLITTNQTSFSELSLKKKSIQKTNMGGGS